MKLSKEPFLNKDYYAKILYLWTKDHVYFALYKVNFVSFYVDSVTQGINPKSAYVHFCFLRLKVLHIRNI